MLARRGVNHGARNAAFGARLVDVRRDQGDILRGGVVRIKIFPIDQRIHPPLFHFSLGDTGIFVILVSHAIASVFVMLTVIGSDRAVGGELFDLQIDVTAFRDRRAMSRLVMLVVATLLRMMVTMLAMFMTMPTSVTVFVISAW